MLSEHFDRQLAPLFVVMKPKFPNWTYRMSITDCSKGQIPLRLIRIMWLMCYLCICTPCNACWILKCNENDCSSVWLLANITGSNLHLNINNSKQWRGKKQHTHIFTLRSKAWLTAVWALLQLFEWAPVNQTPALSALCWSPSSFVQNENNSSLSKAVITCNSQSKFRLGFDVRHVWNAIFLCSLSLEPRIYRINIIYTNVITKYKFD